MAEFCGSTPDEWRANPHCYKYQADGVTINEAANACYSSYKSLTGGKHNTDPAIRDYDNGLWHHLVVTTRPDGQKGFSVYLDGVLRAASPYVEGVGTDHGYADPSYLNHLGVGGQPINPVGDIRLCGREKPATWSQDQKDGITPATPGASEFDPKRYFRGKVAHFSVWSSALSQGQVNELHKSYVDKYHLTVTPFKMPANIPTPMAYYFMDEGHGRNLKESVTQASDAGQVLYVTDEAADATEARAEVVAWAASSASDDDDDNDYSAEIVTAAADVAATAAADGLSRDATFAAGRAAAEALHDGLSAAEVEAAWRAAASRYSHQHYQANEPNWVHDDYFGRTIACGEIDQTDGSHQKDFIALADVDYGANGKWAMSVWYRHEPEANFAGYQREQVSAQDSKQRARRSA